MIIKCMEHNIGRLFHGCDFFLHGRILDTTIEWWPAEHLQFNYKKKTQSIEKIVL